MDVSMLVQGGGAISAFAGHLGVPSFGVGRPLSAKANGKRSGGVEAYRDHDVPNASEGVSVTQTAAPKPDAPMVVAGPTRAGSAAGPSSSAEPPAGTEAGASMPTVIAAGIVIGLIITWLVLLKVTPRRHATGEPPVTTQHLWR